MLCVLWISGSSATEMENRLSGWKRELLRAHSLIAGLFARSEVRGRSLAYMQGLLSGCERKKGWDAGGGGWGGGGGRGAGGGGGGGGGAALIWGGICWSEGAAPPPHPLGHLP